MEEEPCRYIEKFQDPNENVIKWACVFVPPEEPSAEVVDAQIYLCPLRIKLDRECIYSEFGGPFPY